MCSRAASDASTTGLGSTDSVVVTLYRCWRIDGVRAARIATGVAIAQATSWSTDLDAGGADARGFATSSKESVASFDSVSIACDEASRKM